MNFVTSACRSFATAVCSRQPTKTLPDQVIRIRKVFLDSAFYISRCVSYGSGALSAVLLSEESATGKPPTFLRCVTMLLAVGGYLAGEELSKKSDETGKILTVADASFQDLIYGDLLGRLPVEEERAKFLEAQEAVLAGTRGQRIHFFCDILFNRLHRCPELLTRGVVLPSECRFEHYGLDLKDLRAWEIERYFPFREGLFLGDDFEDFPEAFEEECERQQALYEQVLVISNRYPDRDWDFDNRRDYWDRNPHERAQAREQQFLYIEEINELLEQQ